MRALAALALIVALNAAGLRVWTSPYPSVDRLELDAQDAASTAALVSLGMRRLAADLAFVRLLLYYGTREGEAYAPEDDLPDEEGGSPWGFPVQHAHGFEYGKGSYPELGPRAHRILRADPFFTYATLYAAGALAFNLERLDEAAALLAAARAYQPREWKLVSYLAAVGFHRQGAPEKVIGELLPLVDEPDCPTMIKNMAAFMSLRLGRRDDALRIYRAVLESRDPAYRHVAERALARLGATK